jgi:hypothetical protein
MNIATTGRLVVEGTTEGHLYTVRFLRLGGGVGIPEAIETTTESALNIAVSDGGTTPWFRYVGWRLGLDQATEWNLSLTGTVSGDLSTIEVGSLTLFGNGHLSLGDASKPIPVSVMGDYVVDLPADTAARATGSVQVPSTWNEGASPTSGDGWIFVVAEGGSLRINQP